MTERTTLVRGECVTKNTAGYKDLIPAYAKDFGQDNFLN